ncbi:MAG: ABC transporter ATP-binding protein [Anaerolineaceae bacterium]|nr:ABC transporter ATP-binding protein [Anaerolineaceae bacterium]
MEKENLLELKNVRKVFGQTVALDSVSFTLYPGEIHGLLGGNGAGKTTLMNVLYGLYRKDDGDIILKGEKVNVQGPRDAIKLGIGMVHQHFLQISNFTVLENIVLGTDVNNRYTMKLEDEAKKVEDLCKHFGLDVDLNATMDTLPVGTRQKVEILKALYRGVDILILDEPTTNLTPQEVDALFVSLRVMVNDGLSIVFITHKLREVLSVCDRITVLREGRNITSLVRENASEEIFVRAMVGESMDIKNSIYFSQGERKPVERGETNQPIFQMEDISLVNKDQVTLLKNISLTLHPGEILGISGVAGNGQRELAETVIGVKQPNQGKITLRGEEITEKTNEDLFKMGISYIPEDRLHDGFLPKANVAQNLILGYHRNKPYSDGTFINWKTVFKETRSQIKEYNIKTSGPDDIGGNLSGGNIQRVMIARAFSMPSDLMIAHNPTRGLDIPSMDFVYQKMLKRREDGFATLLISEDLDELLRMADRIAVIYRGEILGVLERDQFDKYAIGRLMSGIKDS